MVPPGLVSLCPLAFVGTLLGHACGLPVDAAGELAVDGRVHVLTEANFEASVRSFPYTFVEFYAPWCGHCKRLEPEWEKTAELAVTYDVLVAKVDAISEEKLAETHGVQSFPQLFLFKGDPAVAAKYHGPRDAPSMADWLSQWTRGWILARPDATEAALKAWAPTSKLKVVGLLSGQAEEDAALEELLEAAGFILNPAGPGVEVPVAVTPLPGGEMAKLGITGVSLPCIALLRDFDFEDRTVIYEDYQKGLKSFMAWLDQKRVPALIPATKETEQFFLKDIQPGSGIAILFGSDQSAGKEIYQLAVEMATSSRALKWVHAKKDEFGQSLAKSVGLEAADFPEFVLWEFGESEDDDHIFKLSQQDGYSGFPERAQDLARRVRSFVGSWQSKSLSAQPAAAGKASSAKATEVMAPPAAKQLIAKNAKFKEVPCPVDADIFACATWCEESSSASMKLMGTLGGKPCAEWMPGDALHDVTTCTCYDEDFTEAQLSCKPDCQKAKVKGDVAGTATCSAGDTSCMAGSTVTTPYDEDDDIAADF